MAPTTLNYIQTWTPSFNPFLDKQQKPLSYSNSRFVCKTASPKNQPAPPYDMADRIFRYEIPFESTIATRPQEEGFATGVQVILDRDNVTNCDDEVEEDFPLTEDSPLIEENWKQSSLHGILMEYQDSTDTIQHLEESVLDTSKSRFSPEISRLDNSTRNNQGTRDKPVIFEDGASDTPNLEATAVSVLVDAHFEPSTELWYNIEGQCFVDEDLSPISLLEQRGLASTPKSTPAQDQPRSLNHSPGSSQEQINLYDNNKIIGTISGTTLESEDKDGVGWNTDNVAELEREVQCSLDCREHMESTSAPSSMLWPDWPSTEAEYAQIDLEDNNSEIGHSRFEPLRRGSLLYKNQKKLQEQEQQQKAATELLKEDNNLGNIEDREPHIEKQQCLGENRKMNNDKCFPKDDCSRNTSDAEDEDPLSAKRRKLSSTSTTDAWTQSNEPTPINHDHYSPLCSSRSPSAIVESAVVAEYQEWTFQGFLKRTRIGNETTYNLEFILPHMPEHFHLPFHSTALCTGSKKDLSTKATISHQASTPRKSGKKLTEEQERLLAKLVSKDKTWAKIGERFPGHPIQSLKDNFFLKQGGKPRKRGRKPGVRVGYS